MTRSLLTAVLVTALLTIPAAATAATPEELALAQERAYMQQAPPTTPAERALAQERTYTRTATVATSPARPATPDNGPPPALLAAIAAAALLTAVGIVTARRRHVRRPAVVGDPS